jgi:high-affinity iron transporter
VLLAFLVVFREGFETVLFYEALAGRATGVALGMSAVSGGFVVGIGALAVIAVALFRYGMRIPVRPFFAATGVLLYLLAFKFAGAGVRELQEAGWISATSAPIPDIALLRDWLAVYPLLEPLLAQGVLVIALIAGALVTLRGGTTTLHAAEAARR